MGYDFSRSPRRFTLMWLGKGNRTDFQILTIMKKKNFYAIGVQSSERRNRISSYGFFATMSKCLLCMIRTYSDFDTRAG